MGREGLAAVEPGHQPREVDDPAHAGRGRGIAHVRRADPVEVGEVAPAQAVHEVADAVGVPDRPFDRPAVHHVALPPGHLAAPGEPVGVGRRGGRGDDVVAGRDQGGHEPRPDVPGRPEDQDPHQASSVGQVPDQVVGEAGAHGGDDGAHGRVHGRSGHLRERELDRDRQLDAQVGALTGLLQHVPAVDAGLLVGPLGVVDEVDPRRLVEGHHLGERRRDHRAEQRDAHEVPGPPVLVGASMRLRYGVSRTMRSGSVRAAQTRCRSASTVAVEAVETLKCVTGPRSRASASSAACRAGPVHARTARPPSLPPANPGSPWPAARSRRRTW